MLSRRDFLLAISAPALIGLTRKAGRPIAGHFVDDGGALGHRLRDPTSFPAPRERRRVPIVIAGGGIAGLSAGWELRRRGVHDFVLLEMEREPGGNSRAGANEVSAYPWAAHYVPVPDRGATLVRELFEEMGILRDGLWEERHLTFAPQERLFLHGEWRAGLEPEYALDAAGRAAFRRFDERIAEHRASGAFTIPTARGRVVSAGGAAVATDPLDGISMAEWLARERVDHPALRWYVDYACRDDYGALAAQTSAWAGIHYFASRAHEEQGPLTWPEGNAFIARHLAGRIAPRVVTGAPAYRIERAGLRWRVRTPRVEYEADAVIFAAPTFLAPYLVPALAHWRPGLVYSPWLTANLTLARWPDERARGAPPAWDNVLYDSPGLGYVVATHQSLATHQPRTVWTYYRSLAELTPAGGRALLQRRSWADWVEAILADLGRAHPDLRACVSRVDVMRMGHAMVRPVPGFLGWSPRTAERALPRLVFANSDVGGLSLFEEAQYRGVAAARRAIAAL